MVLDYVKLVIKTKCHLGGDRLGTSARTGVTLAEKLAFSEAQFVNL